MANSAFSMQGKRGSSIFEEEPSYWGNSFKFWYSRYQNSHYRVGMVHRSHFGRPDFEEHNISYDVPFGSKNRRKSRVYNSPYTVNYPRECNKQLYKYRECRKEQGVFSIVDDVPQCNDKKEAIFNDCPHWVLENLALKKRFYKRAELIDTETYQRAMEVSDYNK